MQLQLFLLCHTGVEPVAGLGPRIPYYGQALHKCPTSVLPLSGYELCMLQPFHLRLAAQQGTNAPQRVSLSLPHPPEEDGGEIQELNLRNSCSSSWHAEPMFICKLAPATHMSINVRGVQENTTQLFNTHLDHISPCFLSILWLHRIQSFLVVSPKAVLKKECFKKIKKKSNGWL